MSGITNLNTFTSDDLTHFDRTVKVMLCSGEVHDFSPVNIHRWANSKMRTRHIQTANMATDKILLKLFAHT